MAAVTNTSKSVLGAFAPTAILLATSGDTLTYNTQAGQALILFNTDVGSINVTIDGAGGTTVAVPGAGALTASVAAGLVIACAPGVPTIVMLDSIPAYLAGAVSIVAATGAKVSASIIY